MMASANTLQAIRFMLFTISVWHSETVCRRSVHIDCYTRCLPLFRSVPLSHSAANADSDVRWRVWDFLFALLQSDQLAVSALVFFLSIHHTLAPCNSLAALLSQLEHFSFTFDIIMCSFPVFEHFLQCYFCHVDYYLMPFQSIHTKMQHFFVDGRESYFLKWRMKQEEKKIRLKTLFSQFTRENVRYTARRETALYTLRIF